MEGTSSLHKMMIYFSGVSPLYIVNYLHVTGDYVEYCDMSQQFCPPSMSLMLELLCVEESWWEGRLKEELGTVVHFENCSNFMNWFQECGAEQNRKHLSHMWQDYNKTAGNYTVPVTTRYFIKHWSSTVQWMETNHQYVETTPSISGHWNLWLF